MRFKDKIVIFSGLLVCSMLVISSTLSLYIIKPDDININIDVASDVETCKVNFYYFASASATTPTIKDTVNVEKGKKISSKISSLPSVATSLGNYRFNNTYSTSTSFNGSISPSMILNTTVNGELNYYPNYTGYFLSNSTSGSKIALSLTTANTYTSSSNVSYIYNYFYIYSNIKGSSTYSALTSKQTLYISAYDSSYAQKYTFSYNSSTKKANAIFRFYYQSSNNDFPTGYNPILYMWNTATSLSPAYPGSNTMTWYKDLSGYKQWYFDVDLTIYQNFHIVKNYGSGNWNVQYGSTNNSFTFKGNNKNMLAYSSVNSEAWYTV